MTRILTPPVDGAHLASHDLIYRGPVEHWQSGILLGNGDTNAMAYSPGSRLCYGITRAGLFDTRNPMRAEKTNREIMDLWKAGRLDEIHEWDKREMSHYHAYPYPTPRAAGVLTIEPDHDPAGLRQRLSLRDGVLAQEADGLRVETLISREFDCICFEVVSDRPFWMSFSETPEYPGKNTHWWDNYGGIDEEVEAVWQATDDGFTARCSFPGGDAYCVALKVDGPVSLDGRRIHVTPGSEPIRVYAAVSSGGDGSDFAQQAERRVEDAARAGVADVREAHIRDWHDFWSVNLLALDDRFLENLFYLHQYLLRCGLGGRSNFGGMNPWHLGNQPWHGDMHVNINVEMLWLAVFAINRAELCESYESHFAANLDDARAETRRFWELPGLMYPFSSVGDLRPLHGGLWRYELYVSAWVVQVMWERYRFTGDTDYLRDVCYPLQKEVLQFYESYLHRDESGRVCCPLSKPVEGQRAPGGSPFVKNMLLDVAALRQLFGSAVTASEALEVDEADRARWRQTLADLAPLPCDEERRLFVAYEGADPDLPNDHPTLLGPLYPSGLKLTPLETECAANSLRHILGASRRHMEGFPFEKIFPWGDDLSYSWISIAAARLGDRSRVYAYLYDFLVLLQLKKNGLFASRPSDVATRDRKVSLFNTVGGFTSAVTEMFVQSFDGLVRVFPATPEGFTATFAGLKAAGGFTVDAAQRAGRLLYIRVTAADAGTLELRNDWGDLRIADDHGQVSAASEPVVQLHLQAGERMTIAPVSVEDEPLGYERHVRRDPRVWQGPRYLEQASPEQMWTITLGQ